MPNNKVIVKVGKQSTLQLRDAKVYRAITVAEMESLSKKLDGANIIIIEHIYSSEYSAVCTFLKEYLATEGNRVFFFTPDNDDVTTGVADELDLDIYLTSTDLYHAVQVNCGINFDPDITKPHIDQSLFGDEADIFDNESFQNMLDVASANTEGILADKELPTIKSKDQLDSDDFTDEELGISAEPEETVPEKPSEEVDTSIDSQEAQEVAAEAEEKSVDTPETDTEAEAIGLEISDELQSLGESEIADKLKETIENTKASLAQAQNTIKTLTADLEASKAQKEAMEKQVADLQKEADEQRSKVAKLSDANKAIKAERDAIKVEFSRIEQAPIIEDPAVMTEYQALQVKVHDLEDKLASSSGASSEEVEQLKSDLAALQAQIEALTTEKAELEDKNAKLELSEAELTSLLEAARNDSSKDDRIAELTSQIDELSTKIDGLNAQISEANNTISAKEVELTELTNQLNAEKSSKIMLYSFLEEAKHRLIEAESVRSQVAYLSKSKETLENTVNQLSVELGDAKALATRLQSEANTRVELAKKFVQDELDNSRNENITLKAQLDLLSSRLSAKEAQYEQIVRMTGFDETGASTILETNKTLESMNNDLRRKLGETQSMCDMKIREAAEAKQAARQLQEQRDKLSVQIKAMTTGMSGGMTAGVIPRINFSARGGVISVTGSGSYGITTTAFSLAKRLYTTSRVLFVDFDLLSAKADSWFKMNPIINGIPGTVQNSEKNTTLGLLLERGAPFVIQYRNMLIRRFENSKNGFIDYASGLYYKPDVVRFISADLSAFINSCANEYDYVIIDFGRLGASDINNQLIKVFSAISMRTVVVTSSDRLEIRNTRRDIQEIGININNVAWLVNLASSTKLDDKSRQRISPAEFMVMPFIDDFYGQKKDFSSSRLSRDKLNVFLEKSILRK